MNPLLTFALSTIGAAIGAWLAASLALSRFKRERAFDRRVEWYTRVLEALHQLLWTMHKQIHAIESGEPDKVMGLHEHVLAINDEFALARATAEVFGREISRKALDEATSAVNDIGRLTNAVKGFGFRDPQGVLIRQKIVVLSEARRAVAAEARAELYGSWRERRNLQRAIARKPGPTT